MKQLLQFVPFRSPDDKGWAEALEIIRQSFPHKEQRDVDDLVRALGDPAFAADGIWSDGKLAGILFHWLYGEWHYVEHLAVSPAMRGRHTGSEALGAFCRGKRVILEIDPPEDEISVRRLHFYQRLGFKINPYEYVHPSFRERPEPHRLVLLSYPESLTEEEARRFTDFVRERVMLYSKQKAPTMPVLP